jgi:hypothetical protein
LSEIAHCSNAKTKLDAAATVSGLDHSDKIETIFIPRTPLRKPVPTFAAVSRAVIYGDFSSAGRLSHTFIYKPLFFFSLSLSLSTCETAAN